MFRKILPELYLWTRKSTLKFGGENRKIPNPSLTSTGDGTYA